METLVPPVVVVVVTNDPGPWFDEVLAALAGQDYPEMSVLVLDAASTVDPTPTVAASLPSAYVRRLPENRGFGATANEVLTMVEGAAYFLFCHDDVAPDPDAVHLLVEEAFRSNAGIVAPKLVSWDDPGCLLQVGMAVDKSGAVVNRVETGEVDHGQHDAVRDVFLAPGGCTLVRSDLFVELGGFDPTIFAMGEDLDLCWRAQVLGARVVVAPDARVRHREMLSSGRRPLPQGVTEPAGAVGLQALQRRHELRAVLSSTSWFHLLRILPQLVLLSLGELVVALLARRRDRATAVLLAWRWNLGHRREISAVRARIRTTRRMPDHEVRRLQLRGSARLNAYLRRAVTYGLHVAHLDAVTLEARAWAEEDAAPPAAGVGASPAGREPAGETGAAFPDGPARSGSFADGRRSATQRIVLWAAVILVLVFGSRQILGSGLPSVGQLLPLPSAGTMIHRFLSGWQPTGVGVTGPTTPGLGLLGLAGFLLVGAVGLLGKILVLGCLPLGALGVARLTRPIGSWRARAAATVVYLAVPLPYDSLATGRWDGLLAYVATPWILAILARAGRIEPFSTAETATAPAPTVPLGAVATRRDLVRGRSTWWRRRPSAAVLALGLLEAVLSSLATTGILLTLVVAIGLAAGTLAVGGGRAWASARQVLGTAAGATVLAAVLLAPWSMAVLVGPARLQTLVGTAPVPSAAPGWTALLRLAVGPIGDTPMATAFLVAALLPLVIGAGWRLAWAGRAWVLALLSWVLVWVSGRGWLGPVGLPAPVLLAPAALGLALAVGLGVAAFESDLRGHRFGWRQVVTVLAAAAALVGTVPVATAALGGRWDLPTAGYGQAVGWMGGPPGSAAFRVLWLGDPSLLPGGSWTLTPGLGYTLSEGGLPDATSLWPGSDPGAADQVARDVELARTDDTVRLGALLAPYAIRYVVVVEALAPGPATSPPAGGGAGQADLLTALTHQNDLRVVPGQGGYAVFDNAAALPLRGEGPSTALTAPATGAVGGPPPLSPLTPVLPGPVGGTAFSGRVAPGTVVAALAPASGWRLVDSQGRALPASTVFGYAPRFTVASGGAVTLGERGSWAHGLEVSAEVLLWLAVAEVLRRERRRTRGQGPWPRRGAGRARPDGPGRPVPVSA